MRTFKTVGIVLKRRNYAEADRILTILSREFGKISVKAPGVRRIPSRRSSHVELLNLSQFTLYKSSRSFLPIVTEAQTLESFSVIKCDLKKVGHALYFCELVNGLCADDQENREVFLHLKTALQMLSEADDARNSVKIFEKNLLTELGFWSEAKLLDTCDSQDIMEKLLERKIKTLRILPRFI